MIASHDTKAMKAWVCELFVKCPFGTPRNDCPANEVRCLDLEERFEHAESMSPEELEAVISHHRKCSSARVEELRRKRF